MPRCRAPLQTFGYPTLPRERTGTTFLSPLPTNRRRTNTSARLCVTLQQLCRLRRERGERERDKGREAGERTRIGRHNSPVSSQLCTRYRRDCGLGPSAGSRSNFRHARKACLIVRARFAGPLKAATIHTVYTSASDSVLIYRR